MNKLLLLASGFLLPAITVHAAGMPQLWVYFSGNFGVDKTVIQLEALMKEASAAGYSAFVITDSKFATLGNQSPAYFENIQRIKTLATENHLELIPSLFPVGCSNALLSHDPNLAEGIPVRDVPLIVEKGIAKVAEPAVPLGDPAGLDENLVQATGTFSCNQWKKGEARAHWQIKVQPFRQYRISMEVKTEKFHGSVKAIPLTLDPETPYNYTDAAVKPTQDWSPYEVVFNSFDHRELQLYLGAWNVKDGAFSFRNPRVEEVAFVNLLRRDGAPLVVRRADGTPLAEGRDFEKLADLRCGRVPWPGSYSPSHPPPLLNASLPDGTRLLASYYHAVTFGSKVMICLSEPKTEELLRDMAERVTKLWGARRYMMDHDEIRAVNWDKACQDRKLTPAQIIADNVKNCTGYLHKYAPDAEILVWGDMFDPSHNAHDGYYFLNGPVAGTWEGLDKSIIPVPWSVDIADKSSAWFSQKGMQMVFAGYYDMKVEKSFPWAAAALKYGGVKAVMYTTWENNYKDLTPYAELMKKAFSDKQ